MSQNDFASVSVIGPLTGATVRVRYGVNYFPFLRFSDAFSRAGGASAVSTTGFGFVSTSAANRARPVWMSAIATSCCTSKTLPASARLPAMKQESVMMIRRRLTAITW